MEADKKQQQGGNPSFNEGKVERVLQEFEDQAANPPGGDAIIAACYRAVLEMAQNGTAMRPFLERVLAKRDLTPSHFVNLMLRAAQEEMLFVNPHPTYPLGFEDQDKWEQELAQMTQGEQGNLEQKMLRRETSTTIYQRYLGPRAVMGAVFGNQPIRAVDLGCGGNQGLPGIVSGEPFAPVKDRTPQGIFSQWAESPIQIVEAAGLDKNNPYDHDETWWRRACSFYPQQLHLLPKMIELETRLAEVKGVRFLQGDLVSLAGGEWKNQLGTDQYDMVILSTVLYQLNDEQRQNVIKMAEGMANGTGVVVVQDFASKIPGGKGLNFDRSWFGESFGYRTFAKGAITGGEFWEVLQWNNGRCNEVRAGEDLERLAAVVK